MVGSFECGKEHMGSIKRQEISSLTCWLLAFQGLCLVDFVVFSALLIKFLQNEGNYLNRLLLS